MWLISSDRAELHYFTDPMAVDGGYAILSHVWNQAGEQTFKDLKRLRKRCDASGENPRHVVCDKIRDCCLLAERHGYKWVWIDTCCIDKSSSSELSEAINSMYRYYSLAQVCYAYLSDISTEKAFSHSDETSYFSLRAQSYREPLHNSRWYSRGWTLQELIAPPFLLFVSQSWDVLGSKYDLADGVEQVSGVPADVLRMERRVSEYSVAERMSWASKRQTTRLEDEAYCLLGIFDVNIPTLYGEGSKAFRRLQEEIMKHSPDTTLFAWSGLVPNESRSLLSHSPADFYGAVHERAKYYTAVHSLPKSERDDVHFTLICTPTMAPIPGGPSRSSLATFTPCPHGILAHIPLTTVNGRWFAADLSWYCDRRRVLPLLTEELSGSGHAPPLFSVGFTCCGSESRFPRLYAPKDDEIAELTWTWRTIYLRAYSDTLSSGSRDNGLVGAVSTNGSLEAPFRMHLSSISCPDAPLLIHIPIQSHVVSRIPDVKMAIAIGHGGHMSSCMGLKTPVVLVLGTCSRGRQKCEPCEHEQAGISLSSACPSESPPSHWAHLLCVRSIDGPQDPEADLLAVAQRYNHDCEKDHIPDFVGEKNNPVISARLPVQFGGANINLRSWFTRCPISPQTTLVPHVLLDLEFA